MGPAGAFRVIDSGADAAGIQWWPFPPLDPEIWVTQPLAYPREKSKKKWRREIPRSVRGWCRVFEHNGDVR